MCVCVRAGVRECAGGCVGRASLGPLFDIYLIISVFLNDVLSLVLRD